MGTRDSKSIRSRAQKYFIKLYRDGTPLPTKVAESGPGYTLSGKPLDPNSAAARPYLLTKARGGASPLLSDSQQQCVLAAETDQPCGDEATAASAETPIVTTTTAPDSTPLSDPPASSMTTLASTGSAERAKPKKEFVVYGEEGTHN